MAFDDEDDESSDWDEPQGAGDDFDDGTAPCPACGEPMFEDSPRCPACGDYVSADAASRSPRPRWIVVTVLVCLAAAVWWIVGGF